MARWESMTVILSVASLKGGVGKTTIAENLGIILGRLGRRVLVVDADLAVSGLSALLGLTDHQPNLHDLLVGKGDPKKALCDAYGVKILPSGPSIGGFVRANPVRLAKTLEEIKRDFDYVIVDTPPGLTKYSLAPMKLSDTVISITTQDPPAVEAAAKLEQVAQSMGFKISGVAVNRIKKSSFLHKPRVLGREQIQSRLKSKILVGIPEDVGVIEAATMRRTMVFYKPKSEVVKSIRALAGKLGV
jgi:septum site-determining protein MinD